MANIRYNTKYTKNASSIAELKGKFSDKIGVVVGSGPSLRKIDQTKYLKKYRNFLRITIGPVITMKKINKLISKTMSY